MTTNRSLYQSHILHLAKNTRYWSLITPAMFDYSATNTLCGDHLRLTLRWYEDAIISHVGCDGDGCVICKASASLLAERLMGMKLNEALSLTTEDIFEMLEVAIPPARRKCALLPLRVLLEGAENMGLKAW